MKKERIINSVCICLTFRCDLACRHCFVNSGPNRTEEMSYEEIKLAIDNSFMYVNRMYFSGGEVTVVKEKLLFAIKYAKDKKDRYGYPKNICVQTNGNFANSEKEAFKNLIEFYRAGANEIDITSNDSFHFEQMDSRKPKIVSQIANNMGVFDSVSIGGSEYKVVKMFGRAKSIDKKELDKYNESYISKCVLTESDIVIHPNGNILPCIYGFDNILGNIFKNELIDCLDNKENKTILDKLHNKFNEFINYDKSFSCDICEYCNLKVKDYKNAINNLYKDI
ncbi:radical SAM protein (plasmid) [Clostridium perfringens]|uniref:radical SAM/SPASM domain-containing protein n=1 Tax=Clostridium perfringens TaxID=1502 RepID=UPI0030D24660